MNKERSFTYPDSDCCTEMYNRTAMYLLLIDEIYYLFTWSATCVLLTYGGHGSCFQCWPGADGKYYDDWCDEKPDGSAKCHNYEDQCNNQKPICVDGYDTSNFACVSSHKVLKAWSLLVRFIISKYDVLLENEVAYIMHCWNKFCNYDCKTRIRWQVYVSCRSTGQWERAIRGY